MNHLTHIKGVIPDFKSHYEDLDVIQHQVIMIALKTLAVIKIIEYSFVAKIRSFPL